jgi:hypothetical protein
MLPDVMYFTRPGANILEFLDHATEHDLRNLETAGPALLATDDDRELPMGMLWLIQGGTLLAPHAPYLGFACLSRSTPTAHFKPEALHLAPTMFTNVFCQYDTYGAAIRDASWQHRLRVELEQQPGSVSSWLGPWVS